MARQQNKLTDKAVQAASADGQKRRKLADGGGLTLIVKPNSKVWWLRYRFAGKEKTYSLGSYPEVSLEKAREGRDSVRALRSEEHTSELQSRPHLVCRLLLEQKK